MSITIVDGPKGNTMRIFKTKKDGQEQTMVKDANNREPKVWADNELNLHAEKRAYRRIPANLQARVLYGNLIYSGKVTDISENGMFINTKMNCPVNVVFLLVVMVNDTVMKVPIKVKRTVKYEKNNSGYGSSGIGVELVNTPQGYLDYVNDCKAAA